VRVCAVLASRSALSDSLHARKLGRASIGLSISGIVVSLVIVVITVSLIATKANCKYHSYQGSCYRHKTYVGSSRYCSGVQSGS